MHKSIHFSLGMDYMPAIKPAAATLKNTRIEYFSGPIGVKLNKIKTLLNSLERRKRTKAPRLTPGNHKVQYFLPDWDDLLDVEFDFKNDTFSGPSRKARGDRHCTVVIKPKRISDGMLVSLAQNKTSKGPLRRINGTELNSLSPNNMRGHFGLEEDQFLFGDCGAFSYSNNELPAISVEQAIALYNLYGFDYGASVDHIPVPEIKIAGKKKKLSYDERQRRVSLTKQNAKKFIEIATERKSTFTPVGTIQALSPEEYAETAKRYISWGYNHLALGGLVPLDDKEILLIVNQVVRAISAQRKRPWLHLFGVFRPELQAHFQQLGVDSFDSSTYFRKAWLRSDQNYLAPNKRWYSSLRVPMIRHGATRKKLIQNKAALHQLEKLEFEVLHYCINMTVMRSVK